MRRARLFCALSFLLPAVLTSCGDDNPAQPEGAPSTGLQALLTFSGDATDRSGNGNHGTLLGGAAASGALVVGNNASDVLTLPAGVMDGSDDFTFAADTRIQDGAWHHVTLNRAGASARLYLDGVLLGGRPDRGRPSGH